MSEIWLPGDSDFARAARGWPSVGKKPTGPVEIDWNHHLSKGLISYVLFRGPGDVQDLVSGRDITYTNTKWKSTGQGIALDLSGSGDYASIDNADGRLCQNTTWCVVTNVDYNGNTADQSIAGVQDKSYWWIATGASSLNFWAGTSIRSNGNAILSAGNYTFGVTADGSAHTWHINGNLDKTLATSAIPSASTNDIDIGIDPRDQNGLEWESNIYFLAQYTRALSGQEHALYHRNPYALLKPVNQSPFLISVPAGGGATYEASITFGSELYSTAGNNAILSASISYTNSLGYSDTINALFEVYTTFSKSLTYLNSAESIIDVAIVFSKELASTYQSSLILEAASTFLQSLGQENSNNTDLNASIDLDMIEDDQYNVNASFEEAIVFSNSLANIFTTGNIFNSEISLSTLQSVQSTISAILEAATVYSNAQGISEGNIASLNAVQNFGITQSLLFSSIADLSSDISFNISEDFILNGELVTSGTIDAYTVLAINQGIGSQTGPNIYSPKLNVGIVQNIDSLTIANLFASSVFGNQLVFSTNAGNSIEAAISYGIIQQNIQSIDISIEGVVQFDINQTLSSNVQTEFDGAITLSHQAAVQNVAQAVLNANLPLSCIQDIDVNGSLVSLTLQLPCGRTLRVQIESRSLSVQPENRNTTISGCN